MGRRIADWIPVSKRLPDKDGDYLLWGKVCEDEDITYCFIGNYDSCGQSFGVWQDYYDRNTLGFLDSEFIEYDTVLAWQPLPEPYREDDNGNDE